MDGWDEANSQNSLSTGCAILHQANHPYVITNLFTNQIRPHILLHTLSHTHPLTHTPVIYPLTHTPVTHPLSHTPSHTPSLTHTLTTGSRTYDFDRVSQSAAWIKAINDDSEKVLG